jgi:hypothetical protein
VIRPGDEWGEPTDAAPERAVRGDDAALAAVVGADADAVPLVAFEPIGSELARAVGITGADRTPRGIALPVDAIDTGAGVALNVAILGVAPPALRARHRRRRVTVRVDGRVLHDGPATSVVIANGQFVGAADLVPRGHPGDGRLEVQVYTLGAGERSAMRHRLPTGTHVPHPRIVTTSGREVVVTTSVPWPLTLDAHDRGRHTGITARVRHPALRLLI